MTNKEKILENLRLLLESKDIPEDIHLLITVYLGTERENEEVHSYAMILPKGISRDGPQTLENWQEDLQTRMKARKAELAKKTPTSDENPRRKHYNHQGERPL